MKKMVFLFSLFGATAASCVQAACPITKAVYSYNTSPAVTAQFHPLTHKSLTDVYFTITSSSGQELWFTFDWGNGFSTERLVSSKTNPADADWKPQDPDSKKDRFFSDLNFYAFDKDLAVSSGKIKAGESAPDYIFVPELASTLWYSRHKNIFSDTLGRAMFTLSRCEE